MANIIVRDPNKGVINAWTSIRNEAAMSGIYEDEVFNQLARGNDITKAQSYLAMLASNGKALKDKLPAEYDSYMPETKYSLLSGLSSILNYEENKELIDAQTKNEEFSKYYAQNYGKDWVDTLVNEKFEGDYGKFSEQYASEEGINSLYEEGYFKDSELSPDEVKSGITSLGTAYSDFSKGYVPKEYMSYSKLLDNIAKFEEEARKFEAWENTSDVKKIFSTIGHISLNLLVTPIEMVESIADGILYVAGWVGEALGDNTFAREARATADADMIPTQAWLANIFPDSYAASQYTSNTHWSKIAVGITGSISQMLVMIGLNYVAPGVGTAVYYGAAFGQSANEYSISQPDKSMTNVMAYSAIKTAISYAVEGISETAWFQQTGWFNWWEKLGAKNVGLKILHDFVGEGLEEVAEELADALLDIAFTGESDISLQSLGISFISGAIAGGIMSGGHTAINKVIATKTVTKILNNADGTAFEISAAQAAITSDYYSQLDKKVKEGKKLSEKAQAQYDRLKNLSIIASDADGNMIGYIDNFTDQTKNDTFSVETKADTKKLQINEAVLLEKLKEFQQSHPEVSTDDADFAQITDAQIEAEFQNAQTGMFLTLTEMANYMGADAFTKSMQAFAEYNSNSLDTLLDISDEISARKKSDKKQAATLTTREAMLKEAFGSDIYLQRASKDVATPINKAGNFGDLNVYYYMSTDPKLPVVFQYGTDVYVNKSAVNNFTSAKIQQLIFSTAYSSQILSTVKSKAQTSGSTTLTIIDELISSYGQQAGDMLNETRLDIMRQQMLFTALFVPNNTVASKLYMSSKSEYNQLFASLYKDSLYNKNVNLGYVIATAEKNYYTTALNKVIESESTEALKDLQAVTKGESVYFKNDEDIERFKVNNYDPKAYRYMTFKADVTLDAADLGIAIEYFAKQLGFKLPENASTFSLTQVALSLFNRGNYDNISALDQALSTYNEYLDGKISFQEKLNYFLADNFGFQVTRDNQIIHLREISQMIDLSSAEIALDDLSGDIEGGINSGKHYMLSELLTDYGKLILGPALNGNDYRINVIPETRETLGGGRTRTNGATNTYLRPVDGEAGLIVIPYNSKNKNRMSETLRHEINHAISNTTGIKSGQSRIILENAIRSRIESRKNNANYLATLQRKFETFYDGAGGKDGGESGSYIYFTLAGAFDTAISTGSPESIKRLSQWIAKAVYYFSFQNELTAHGESLANSNPDVMYQDSYYTMQTDALGRQVFSSIFYTNSQFAFLKEFDGMTGTFTPTENAFQILNEFSNHNLALDPAVNKLLNNYTDIASEESVEIEQLFGENIEDETKLVSKNFWLSNLNDPNLKNAISAMPTEDFIRFVANLTHKEFDVLSKTYQSVASTEILKQKMNIPFSPDRSYAAALVKGTKPRNLQDPNSVYTMYTDNATGVLLFDKSSGSLSVNLDNVTLGPSTLDTLKKTIAASKPGNRYFNAADRTFNNINNALKFIDTKPQSASLDIDTKSLSGFETVFTELSKLGITGYQQAYKYDTIFVTNDGKIINLDSAGNLTARIQKLCNTMDLSEDMLGSYTVDASTGAINLNDEGLTNQLSRLFDSKRVARFVRKGDNWNAFGTLNILQDKFAKTIMANVDANSQSYIQVESNRAIVQDPVSLELKIVKKSADGTFEGTEVAWKKNKWYAALCNIFTKYNITSFKQLRNLGFSDKFIDAISTYTGTKTDNAGITHSLVLDYINDDTNTVLSRNILIENCPDSSSSSLDWKRNGYITSVQDIKQYQSVFNAYYPALRYAFDRLGSDSNNAKLKYLVTTVYNNLDEMHKALDSFVSAHEMTDTYANYFSKLEDIMNKRRTNLATDILNIDAQKKLTFANGLNYSFNSFDYVFQLIRKEWGRNQSVIGMETTTSDGDVLNILDKMDKTKDNVQSNDITAQINTLDNAIKEASQLTDKTEKLEAYNRALDLIESVAKDDIYDNINTDAYAQLVLDQMDRLEGVGLSVSRSASDFNQKLVEQLENVKKLEGVEREQANADIETEFNKFSNERIKNTYLYGYEGYKQIRKTYDQYGASQRFNTSSKMSKRINNFKKSIDNAIKDNLIDSAKGERLVKSAEVIQNVYQNTLRVPVDYTYNGLTRSKAIDQLIQAFDDFRSGKNIRDKIKQLADFVDTAAINSTITYNEDTKLAETSFRFSAEQRKFLYKLYNYLKDASAESKAEVYLDYLNDPNSETELGRPLVAVLEKFLDDLKIETDTAVDSTGAEEAIDFDRLNRVVEKAGIKTEELKKDLIKNDKKPARRILDQDELDALTVSRATVRTLSTQRRFADLLNDSKPATTIDMQEALKKAHDIVMSYEFVSTSDRLRKEANRYYKFMFPAEAKQIFIGTANGTPASDIEAMKANRKRIIDTYMLTHQGDFGVTEESKDYHKENAALSKYHDSFISTVDINNLKGYAKGVNLQEFLTARIATISDEMLKSVAQDYYNKMIEAISDNKPYKRYVAEIEYILINRDAKVYHDYRLNRRETQRNADRYEVTRSTWEDLLKKQNEDHFVKKYDPATGKIKSVKVKFKDQTIIKVANGLNIAYQRFIYGPKTKANIEQFLAEVKNVLSDKSIDQVIPGTKERIKLNAIESDPNGERILSKLKSGEYVDHSNVFNTQLNEITSDMQQAQEVIDKITNATRLGEPRKTSNKTTTKSEIPTELPDSLFDSDTAVETDTTTDNIPDELPDDLFDDTGNENIAPSGAEESIDFDNLFGDDVALQIPEILNSKGRKKAEPRTEDQMYATKDSSRNKFTPTINSKLLTRNNVDVRQMLDYIPSKTKDIELGGETETVGIFSTREFLKDNATKLNDFLSNEAAVKDFLEWYNASYNLTDAERTNAAVLMNQISTRLTLPAEIRNEALKNFAKIKRAAGQQLSIARNIGLTPIDQIGALAEEALSLSDEEISELTKLSEIQKQAIAKNDYKLADDTMEKAMTILQKHSSELDRSINPWAKNLTQDEKAVRWHNLTQRITSWRYFAMLSAPATFFSRNVAGNALITVMDKASTSLGGKLFNIGKKISQKITGKQDTEFRYERKGTKVSESARTAVKENLVDNGLLNSIMNNTVSKYDTGYVNTNSKLKRLALDESAAINDIEAADAIVLGDALNERTPFGNSKAGQVLNNFYNKIFGVMDSQDKKSMSKYITKTTEQILADNFTAEDFAKLKANDADTVRRFQEIVNYAQTESLKTYFRYQGNSYTAIMNVLKKHPAAQAVFATIFPFPRMLLNTMSTALSYSPIGFIKAAMTARSDQSAFKDLRVSKQLGQAATGTAAMAVGAILTALGAIAFEDDDQYASPQLVLFDTFRISLEDLAPAAIPFCVGASFTDGLTSGFWDAITNSGSALLDTTIIGELINIFGGNKGALDVVSNTFSTYINQFMPAILRHVTRMTDPHKKQYSKNSGLKFLQKIAAQLPGISYAVSNKVDPYSGADVTYYADNNNPYLSALMSALNAVLPAKISYNKDSTIERESKAVGAATTGPASSFTIDGVSYKIPEKQYREYQKLRAKLYSQYADQLINTAKYKAMTNEQKKKQLKKLQSKATENARKQLNIK